jgi:hypothetical protein
MTWRYNMGDDFLEEEPSMEMDQELLEELDFDKSPNLGLLDFPEDEE